MKKISRILSFVVLLFSLPVHANIMGSDLQNFNPTTDGLGYVTVHASETLEPGQFNLGLFLDYSWNSLPTIPSTNNIDPDDTLFSSNFHLALGLMKGWSVGLSMSHLLSESTNDSSFAAAFTETGQEETRLETKVRLLNNKKSGASLVGAINFNATENNPYIGEGAGTIASIQGVYEYFFSDTLRWAANIGFRSRSEGTAIAGSDILPLSSQILYSTGLSYHHLDWKTYFIGEIYGSSPTDEKDNLTDRELSNLELLLGAKWKVLKNVDWHLGGTTGLIKGLSTPDFRVYTGINWYFGPLWGAHRESESDSDYDGVWDSEDKCPDTPRNSVVDEYGCVTANFDDGPRDSDGDGVFDLDDQCPRTPPGVEVNSVGCEIGPQDSDQDGVMDADDECPGTPFGTPVDSRGCAEGPGDSDGDGVTDDYDLCPGTARGVKVNSRGCPPKKMQSLDLGNLNFITGTAKLTKNSRIRFRRKVDKLYPQRKRIQRIVVEGHTDNVGKAAYNLKLSRNRAYTIRRLLIKYLKISGKKVKAKGYGESRPISTNKTKRGRLINRRVELNLIMK